MYIDKRRWGERKEKEWEVGCMDPDLDTHLCREKVHGGGTRALLTEGHETLLFPIVPVEEEKKMGRDVCKSVTAHPVAHTHACIGQAHG